MNLPPQYILREIETEDVILKPTFPVSIIPCMVDKVQFMFTGTGRFNFSEAFNSNFVEGHDCRAVAIDYTIIVIKDGVLYRQDYKHKFVRGVMLTRNFIRRHGQLVKFYGGLTGMPILPRDWKYMQFDEQK